LAEILEVAKRAARGAGELIRNVLHGDSQRSEIALTKSNTVDLVTETDQKCEELVMSIIRHAYPEHVIIGEESSGTGKYTLTDVPTWTVDPIDGTTNFVHHLSLSCVIIAYLCNKEVCIGVVYDPMADELFSATQGGGAFLERGARMPTQIRVSDTKAIPQAVISMDPGYGRDAEAVDRFTACQAALLKKGLRNVRTVGSTGLNMAWVACGRLDAGFEQGSWELGLGPKIWDFSAGKLLVEEAGGVTRDVGLGLLSQPSPDSPLDLMGRSFFCGSTSELAAELLAGVVGVELSMAAA